MTGILSSAPATRTVDTSVAMDKIPEWFPGARLNYAENLLRWAHLRRNVVELSSYFRNEDSSKTLYKCLQTRPVYFTISLLSMLAFRLSSKCKHCVRQ